GHGRTQSKSGSGFFSRKFRIHRTSSAYRKIARNHLEANHYERCKRENGCVEDALCPNPHFAKYREEKRLSGCAGWIEWIKKSVVKRKVSDKEIFFVCSEWQGRSAAPEQDNATAGKRNTNPEQLSNCKMEGFNV